MKNQDRSTKVLLALLVAGVWGLLLRPVISTTPASAQVSPFSSRGTQKQYAMAVAVTLPYTLTKEDAAFQNRVRAKAQAEWTPEEQERDLQITTDKMARTTHVVQIGGNGRLSLNTAQVSEAIELASEEGWNVHSVVPTGTNGNFLVVLEK